MEMPTRYFIRTDEDGDFIEPFEYGEWVFARSCQQLVDEANLQHARAAKTIAILTKERDDAIADLKRAGLGVKHSDN